jgi:DNA-binding transcriptional ArsR family regulator
LPDDLVELMHERLAALADPARIRLLDRLRGGSLTVAEITATVPTSQQNVSKHLGRLHRAGLVRRRRDGNHVFYAIASPAVLRLLDLVARDVLRDVDALAERVHRAGRDG